MIEEKSMRCPCNSGDTFQACCGKYLESGATATPPTAQALMRSRFSAFATGNVAYLLASWHPKTRPAELELDSRQQWLRLDVLGTEAGGPWDDSGTVHFVAHFRFDGERGQQEENSRFLRTDKRWYYLDAVENADANHQERG